MGQTLGLDITLFIYLFEEHPKFFLPTREVFRSIEIGKHNGVFASLGLIELLTGPKQLGQFALANEYKNLITHFPNLIIGDLNEKVIESASSLRAEYHIPTPDAIHLATAIEYGAKVFVTNDKRLKKVKQIKIQIIGS